MSLKNDTELLTRTKNKTEKPKKYGVVILNDDYTSMDFVTQLLSKVFNINADTAHQHMWEIHTKGSTQFAPYSHDVADTKVTEIMDAAKKEQHPLLARVEPLP
jgi:ATP-dependent Clp protease adaptor protein ClpS